jgi:hypothetical protein
LAEFVNNVGAEVVRIARKTGHIYLLSDRFPGQDIEVAPSQVRKAGFEPGRIREANSFVVLVRIENNGGLRVSKIISINGELARPPGPRKKRRGKK